MVKGEPVLQCLQFSLCLDRLQLFHILSFAYRGLLSGGNLQTN